MEKEKRKKRDLTAGTYTGDKIPKKTSWIYSMSGIFRDACYALVSANFLIYAQSVGLLGTGDTYIAQMSVITAILVVCLIWDGLNDPIMGIIVEKCHFKTGKFRPWILIGAAGNTAMVLLMFLARPSGWWFVVCFGVFYLLWDFVFTMNDLGYWSMLPSLTNDEKERNKITTMVTVATTIGSAAMYAITALMVNASNVTWIYGAIAIPTAILFFLSQVAVFFLCKEHARDPKQDEISSHTKFKDLFVMFAKNKPLRMTVIAIFSYYVLGAVLTGFGYNYFYFIYGYGGNLGGTGAIFFLGVYILSAVIAQVLYPLIAKHVKQMTIITVTFAVSTLCFVAFFLLGAPIFGETPLAYSHVVNGHLEFFNGTGWLILIPVFFFSAAMGIFYLALLVMMQNAIDYNEWKFGERKESVAFAWRPLDAKISSALEKGLYLLALVGSGTMAFYNTLNDASAKVNAQEWTTAQEETAIQKAIDNLSNGSVTAYTAWLTGSLVFFMVLAFLVMRLGYHISEGDHAKIQADLAERHRIDAEEAAKAKTIAPKTSETEA
ncbi:MAG: MFS transporter [Bacilli bacterium]|jgi:melibiose permease/lactose/raffinose/galactose permease|nr:MFS transporter [Bacilli bacterium]